MKTKNKNKKIQKSLSLSAQSDKYIRVHMKEQKLQNYSAAVDDAIEYAFNPEMRGERESELTKKMSQFMFSLNDHRKKTARDLTIIREIMTNLYLDLYVRTPPVPDDLKDMKHNEALSELDKKMKQISQELQETRVMKEEE